MMINKTQQPSTSEKVWQGVFFIFSATVAAHTMVDISNGVLLSALGNLGIALLMVSMIYRFPFLRAFVDAGAEAGADPNKKRAELLQEAERLRVANPWPSRMARLGWFFFAASLLLRLTAID